MQLEAIRLGYFRNYQDVSLTFPEGVTILAGENAQGKTNLLEAIFLLTGGRSWRAARRGDLISFQQSQARIEAKVFSRQRKFSMELTLPRRGNCKAPSMASSKNGRAIFRKCFAACFFPRRISI